MMIDIAKSEVFLNDDDGFVGYYIDNGRDFRPYIPKNTGDSYLHNESQFLAMLMDEKVGNPSSLETLVDVVNRFSEDSSYFEFKGDKLFVYAHLYGKIYLCYKFTSVPYLLDSLTRKELLKNI